MPNLQQALPTLMEKFWDILKKSIGGFLGVTGFLLSLILVPIYLFFLLNEKPRIERTGRNICLCEHRLFETKWRKYYRRSIVRNCLFSWPTAGVPDRWHTHRRDADAFWPQFCAGDWCACCCTTMIPYIGIISAGCQPF